MGERACFEKADELFNDFEDKYERRVESNDELAAADEELKDTFSSLLKRTNNTSFYTYDFQDRTKIYFISSRIII